MTGTNYFRMKKVLDSFTTDRTSIRNRWLELVATRAITKRPDLRNVMQEILQTKPGRDNLLAELTIGEIGVCYEAILAWSNNSGRKTLGQFFTPDDAAMFMAKQSESFDEGIWLDPCCGVGNLSWHLTSIQENPGVFLRDKLILIDLDDTALKSAVALISADWAEPGDSAAVRELYSRSQCRDFLSEAPLPEHDYIIANPPYSQADKKEGYKTANTKELFAFFMEKIAYSSEGFIAVTPSSYLSAAKFQCLRDVLNEKFSAGRVYSFDNMPDTLFRGFKYGSDNTSRKNSVRASITVCSPGLDKWETTPIIRWLSGSREIMFKNCCALLAPRLIGPNGQWVKLIPGLDQVWKDLISCPSKVSDLLVPDETQWSLDVALTPRYYISASSRPLDRNSKITLYFKNEETRDGVAAVLNSSLPYLWWRALDGGVTLPVNILLSTPVPDVKPSKELMRDLWVSEANGLVTKLNAGRANENIKHSDEMVAKLNTLVLPSVTGFQLWLLYTNDMLPN